MDWLTGSSAKVSHHHGKHCNETGSSQLAAFLTPVLNDAATRLR